MVTAELAIGILSATMLAVVLAWGIQLLALQTECADVAAQAARAAARGDQAGLAVAKGHAPNGAQVDVDTTGTQVDVTVSVKAAFGHLFSVPVTRHASMPKEPGT